MISENDFATLKYQTLKHFWGYDHFRDSQEEIINKVIAGKDTLVLLPTGGGKSLCYQLPALILEGTCIVVSPLLALMKDQVHQLKNLGIEAEYLSSELDDFDAEVIYNRCKDGLTKLLYVSPERLKNTSFIQNIEEIKISFLAVDEAHCISEWGQDFRPSYQNIKNFRAQLNGICCLALTATATPKVLEEIKKKLDLKNAEVFQKSFRRNNIRIFVNEIADKYQRIFDILKNSQASGIIYTRTRKEAEDLSRFLKSKKISNVDYYHAGLSAAEKNSKQSWWLNSPKNVLVSTNAFGMGIDKENVRFVMHLSPPASIENYYQEIGRAGRDGEESFAFLWWNESELSNINQLIYNQIPNKAEFEKIISYLYSTFQIAENDFPEKVFQLNIQNIQNFTKTSLAKIRNVLNFLYNQEVIYLNQNKSLSTLKLNILPEEIDLLARKDAHFIELLLRNLSGSSSQKVFFSEQNLSSKLQIDVHLIRERIRELQQKNYLEYIDGALSSVKFLKPRDDRAVKGKYWNLFEQIQKNKLQKWEEMKFYIQDRDFCKMRLILSYFGEKETKNCGICYVCSQKSESILGRDLSSELLILLRNNAFTVDDFAVKMPHHRKENILESLIYLLECDKIKMLNYKTYVLK